MFCQYKDLFGKPKTGVHKYRIFGLAAVDVILTVLAALLIAYVFNVSFWITLLVLFILGICLHHLFCVDTTIDKLIFQ